MLIKIPHLGAWLQPTQVELIVLEQLDLGGWQVVISYPMGRGVTMPLSKNKDEAVRMVEEIVQTINEAAEREWNMAICRSGWFKGDE